MRKLLITLVVLAVLLVAADFGLRVYAESRTATAIQTQLATTSVPDVSIEGFPFLWHAVRGEYPQVVVTASDVDTALLPGTSAVLTLSQVALPLSDALAGNTSQLTAQASTLQLVVPLTSLSAVLGNTDLTLSAAPDGGLAVRTTVSVLGQPIVVNGTATITVADNTLTLAVDSLSAAGVNLTPAVTAAANALAGTLTRSLTLTDLPFTITQGGVTVTGGDVVITASTGPITLADLK